MLKLFWNKLKKFFSISIFKSKAKKLQKFATLIVETYLALEKSKKWRKTNN